MNTINIILTKHGFKFFSKIYPTGCKLFKTLEGYCKKHRKVRSTSCLQIKQKTAFGLREHGEYVNETIPTSNLAYLLYCMGCFLEDYIPEKTLKRIEKQYGKKEMY